MTQPLIPEKKGQFFGGANVVYYVIMVTQLEVKVIGFKSGVETQKADFWCLVSGFTLVAGGMTCLYVHCNHEQQRNKEKF